MTIHLIDPVLTTLPTPLIVITVTGEILSAGIIKSGCQAEREAV